MQIRYKEEDHESNELERQKLTKECLLVYKLCITQTLDNY